MFGVLRNLGVILSKKKRDLLQVYFDVLNELRNNPMRITHIMRKCNLDTRMTKQVISMLVSKGLIILKNQEDHEFYYVTEKELNF